MSEVKMSEILQLDCRIDSNAETVQQILGKIKPFKKYNEKGKKVPLKQLEKAIKQFGKKTDIIVHSLVPDIYSNDSLVIWRCEIINTTNLSKIATVYGCSLYEVMAKATIILYSKAKSRKE